MGHALESAAHEAGIRICLLDTCYRQQRVRRAGRGGAGALQRRRRRAMGGAAPGDRAGARSTPCARCRATSCAAFRRPGAAARPPLRAGRRERRLPRGVRRHPDPAAARGRRCSARPPPSCTPPTSPTTTSSCSAPPAPTSASRPTTERDLADGIGPAGRLARRGLPDHARQRQPRGHRPVRGDARRSRWTSGWPPRSAATGPRPSCSPRPPGTRRSGFADAGAIAVGQRADLVTLDTASPRTAGTGADEHTAVVRGHRGRRHPGGGRRSGRVHDAATTRRSGASSTTAIGALWPRP